MQADGTMRGNNPIIKNETGTHKAILRNGYVIINRERTAINAAWGEVNLQCPSIAKEIPLFKGFVSLTHNAITPMNVINITDSSKFGKLPTGNLVFNKVELTTGRALFNYNKLIVDLPGIRVVDSETQRDGEIVHFHPIDNISLDDQGKIYGTAEDFMIEVGTILLKFTGVQINGTALGNVSFSSTNYRVNYIRFIGDSFDIPEWGGITITSDKDIKFDNDVISCPSFDIQMAGSVSSMYEFGFGFQAPKMSFRFVPEMSSWVLDVEAGITLPISFSGETNASGSTTGISASGGGSCSVSGSTALMSIAPYFHDFHFSSAGCFEIMVFPFVFWTGLSGYVDLYSEESRVTGFGLGGSVDFSVKVPVVPLPLASGTVAVDLNSLGLLKLSGEAKAFGFWPMNKAAIWFDWADMDGVTIGAAYDAYWCMGIVNAHLEGEIGLNKNFISRPDLYFEGLAKIQIPQGIINLFGLFQIPDHDIILADVGAQIGQFKYMGEDKGYGLQAFVELWDLDFAAFIPLEKGEDFRLMCHMYELVRFQRSMAMRRKGNINKMSNVVKFCYGMNSDTLIVNVPEEGSGKLLFGIKSFVKDLPDMTIINPENTIYKSSEMFAKYPGLKTDSGYAFPVKSVKGNWTLIISNITKTSDYKLITAGGTVAPKIKIDDIQKANDYQYKIKYTVNDPSNNAKIYFNYTSSDSSTGRTINIDPITNIIGNSEIIWDIRNVKAGDYKIFARISDGSGNFVKVLYPNTISVHYTGQPNPPQNLKAYRIMDNRIKLRWESEKYLVNKTILYGSRSKVYSDTIRGVYPNEYVFDAKSDTNQFYAIVFGNDGNKNYSPYSDEIHFSLNNSTVDSIRPNAPQKPNVTVVLNEQISDTSKERISLSWSPVIDVAGYNIYVATKSNKKFSSIDVGNKTSFDFYNLSRGETYIFKLQSYSNSKLMGGTSDEVEVNFYSLQDQDGDGMPDEWEIKYFASIDITNSLKDDPDNDGLTNGDELNLGTNPNNTDTDGDGVWDDVDIHPLVNEDNNSNGMGDDWEVYYSVNDPKDDPDHDGLTNIEEYQHRTNPNNPDTDGGGLSDNEEIRRGLNPLDSKDDKWVSGFVQLESFSGKFWRNNITKKDSIVLTWKTNKEKDLSGFNIVRKSSKDNYWMKLNNILVPAFPDTITPHEYTYKDGSIQGGVSYSYFIEGVSKWGNRDSLGIFSTSTFTSIEEVTGNRPDKFELFQNYPNPFNPTTDIRFSVPFESDVQLKVYDLLGREVSTLIKKRMNPGTYSITWNANGLSSGIYIYQLRSNNFVSSKTMMLMR